MSREKMTITWTRTTTRLLTEEDRAEFPDFAAGEEAEFEEEVELPGKFEVCDRCDGHGTHTNPSIDGNGITSSEWAEWDEEEQEMYLTGGYDVTCHECGGKRVVLVIDEEHCDKKLLEEYTKYMDQKAKDDYADRRMRFWENGGYE